MERQGGGCAQKVSEPVTLVAAAGRLVGWGALDEMMLPEGHGVADSDLKRTLELFLRTIHDYLRTRLVSVVLHGSVAFDDLAPGYGDLDFVAVTTTDLDDETCRDLVELRKPLRSGKHGVLAQMLEGVFLPRKMLDPATVGKAFWWGTSGERAWDKNELGWFVLHVIRERGILVWGEDIRREIPVATREDLLAEVRIACRHANEHARAGDLHSVDWLLTVARLLLWVREGRLSSKSEAADWGYAHARGDWRRLLPRAKELRLNPSMAESAEVKQWLASLMPSIRQAWLELEQVVTQEG